MKNDLLKALPDHLNSGVCLLDSSLRVCFWNSWLEQYSGRPAGEVLGCCLTDLFPQLDRNIYRSYFQLALENNRSMFCSGALHPAFITPAGNQVRKQNMQIEPLEVEGRPHVLLQIFDITNQHQRVQMLRKEISKRVQIEQALQEEMENARVLHERSLSQNLPQVEGISFAAHYQPAARMGGDFYDLKRTGNNLVLYLSDVTGHGLDGAMLSVFVKNTINCFISLKPSQQITPDNLLHFLAEQYFKENYPEDYFICIFIAVLNLETMQLDYTGAGFQDAIQVQMGSRKRAELKSRGLPITSTVPLELLDAGVDSIALTPGTTVLFNTDGLTEQRPGFPAPKRGKKTRKRAETQYETRLHRTFYAHSHLPPEAVIHAINKDFYRFNNGSLQGDDDITLGVLQVEPREKQIVQLELDSNLNQLEYLRQQVHPFLDSFPGGELLMAAVHELAANAIEHGNGCLPEKKVQIYLERSDTYLYVVVEDEGEGFNWWERIESNLDLESSSERGRGISMTQLFADMIFYNQKGNTAYLLKEVDPAVSSAG